MEKNAILIVDDVDINRDILKAAFIEQFIIMSDMMEKDIRII